MEYGIKPLGREKLYLWLMLLPTMIGLLFGTIGSLLATLGLSLFDWDLINPPTWAGVSNYVALFQNQKYIEAFVNTLKFAALYVPGVVISSLLLAVLLNRKISRGGVFSDRFFLAGRYFRSSHCLGLEYDLWKRDGDSQLYVGKPRPSARLLAMYG